MKVNLQDHYNRYFYGAEKSLYNTRFGKIKVPTRERKEIIKTFTEASKGKTNVSILDYGCGDGRFFEVIEDIRSKFRYKKIHVVCYDISSVAIEIYKERLAKLKFKKVSEEQNEKAHSYFYKKGRMDFRLICGNESNSVAEIKNVLNTEFDISLCLMGVLNHIPTQPHRIKFLKMLKEITIKKIILTIAPIKLFKEEQEAYRLILKHSRLQDVIKIKGDLFYKHKNIDEPAFAHIFNYKRLQHELSEAGLSKLDKFRISTIIFPSKIRNYLMSKVDELLSVILSYLLPHNLIDRTASYVLINIDAEANK